MSTGSRNLAELKNRNTLLKDVQPGHILTLTRYSDSGELTVESFSKDDGANRSTCTLAIMDEDSNAARLRMHDITYEYMVEMDLARLKSYCKMAQDINSSHMEFKIEEPPPREGSSEKHLFFTIGAVSDAATFKKIHHSTTTTESGEGGEAQFTIRAISTDVTPAALDFDFDTERHLLEEKYNEVFATNYLNQVLKSMDRQTVQLYMSKSTPLVIRYGLGNDFSHVQVILAPRIRDE